MDLVVLTTAEENVCSVLAVEAILAITAVRGVGATTVPKVVIVQTAEERVGINAADFLVVFFDQLILVVPAFLLSTCGSLPSLRQDCRAAPANFRERLYSPKLTEGLFSEVRG